MALHVDDADDSSQTPFIRHLRIYIMENSVALFPAALTTILN